VVRAGHGALHRAGDRDDLAETLRSLLAREDREAMGRAGRAFAEQEADLRKQTARLASLFER
jgi:hypothetical protein